MRKIVVTIPEQTMELEIEEEDYAEWLEDKESVDPLYDYYIHHLLTDDPQYNVEIFDGICMVGKF